MSKLATLQPRATISALPGNGLVFELVELIRSEVARELAAQGGRGESPTFAEYRARAGVTVAELAVLADVSKSYIYDLEAVNVKDPDFGILNKLARALKVEASIFRQHIAADIQRERRARHKGLA